MCVILHLSPGATIDSQKLANAVYNNPHGYGIVVLGDDLKGGIHVEHNVPPNGEVLPDEIEKLLKKYEKYERALHLRWATVGDVTPDNAHPFCVYNHEHSEDEEGTVREAWFMHNGTLHTYGCKSHGFSGVYDDMTEEWLDKDQSVSDSRHFACDVIQPLLNRWEGDYHDYLFGGVINKYWVSNSRGLIISNYAKVWRFGGKWHELDANSSTGTIHASNNDYFDAVKRGPEKDRREEQKRREEAEKKQSLQSADPADDEKKAGKNFFEMVDWEDLENPPINFDKLSSVCGDLPTHVKPAEVLGILRNIANDELAAMIKDDLRDCVLGEFDPEDSRIVNLLYAYHTYVPLLIQHLEESTGDKAEDVVECNV